MLDILQISGFAPLHYEIYWYMGHVLGGPTHLTPFWMRVVPSAAGTLMVPAMYFLARQLCSKRAALLAAAFAASSAYLMAYSHDAKMYMHFWLFCTLNMACLLWWFRTNLRVAWLGWIAAGLAMCGLQAIGLILLTIQPLMLFTQRSMHWKKTVLFIVGFAIILAGPAGYYLGYNKWSERVEENWSASGLTWIPAVIDGRNGTDMVRFVTSAYLYSWEWPADRYDPDRQSASYHNTNSAFHVMLQGYDIDPRVLAALMSAVVAILFLAAVGALPWSARARGVPADQPAREKPWRLLLWLGVWMIVPAYGFYCASVSNFPKPSDWIDSVGAAFSNHWIIVAIELVCLAGICLLSRYIPALIAGGLGVGVLISLNVAVMLAFFSPTQKANGEWWRTVLRVGQLWGDMLLDSRSLLALVLLGPPAVWYYCGKSVLQRVGRTIQFSLAIAAIYGLCLVVYSVMSNRTDANNGPVWMPRYIAFVWPAFAVALCALLMRLPTRPLRWLAIVILLGTNLAQSWGRMFAGSEPPIDYIVRDIWAGQETQSTVRAYVQNGAATPHPAGGTLYNNPGKYYMSVASGKTWPPNTYQGGDVSSLASIWTDTSPRGIAADVRRSRALDHVIVWDRLSEKPTKETDAVLAALGSEWQKAAENYYPVRYHWNWSNLYVARRREYVHKPPPTTRP